MAVKRFDFDSDDVTFLPWWAMEKAPWTPAEKVLYWLMVSLSGEADGTPKNDDRVRCTADNATLAHYLHCSISKMRKCMITLIRDGLIEQTTIREGRINEYRVYYSAFPPTSWWKHCMSYRERSAANKAYEERRQWVIRRDGCRCLACGATEPLSVDHIKPKLLGGSDDPSNLQTLCDNCNSTKGMQTIDYRSPEA